jgi:Phytanoyl-CoA dioxygenase (PhyH)
VSSMRSALVARSGDAEASTEDWLAAVDDLVAAGRALEAVERLAARVEAVPDATLERRLVLLRHEAFLQLPPAHAREPWPPTVDDVFAGVEGIPEVPIDQLTPETLAAGILHHGALLVRGLVDPEQAAELVAGIDEAFAACETAMEQGRDHNGPYFGRFEPVAPYNVGAARSWIWQAGGLWTVDSPRMLANLVEVMEHSGMADVLTGFLGERPALSVKKWTLRRVPVETGTDWHQDGAFLGDEIRTVNVWLTLTHCGDRAPGLDVVPTRIDEILETGTNGAIFDWSVGSGTLEKVIDPSRVIRPIFEAGDALLFDQRCLHRTAVDAAMTQSRYAVESWFFAPSRYPHDQVPVYF